MFIRNKFHVFFWLLFIFFVSCGEDKSAIRQNTKTKSVVNNSANIPSSVKSESDIEKSQSILISDPSELHNNIKNGLADLIFHGFGTEPFWDLYITDNEVLYAVNEGIELSLESFQLLTPFVIEDKEQLIQYKNASGTVFGVKIKKEVTGDGMSDKEYPYSVSWPDDEYMWGAGVLSLKSRLSDALDKNLSLDEFKGIKESFDDEAIEAMILLAQMQKIANQFGGNSNQSASNSNYSNTAQSSSSSSNSCYRCSGSGKCSECSRPQKITYKDSFGATNHKEEIRLGSVVCSVCLGDGISNQYPSVGEPCYISSCYNGWIECRSCYGSGDCKDCHGKGTRD